MPFRPDFVKVLILRDMELGQTGLVFLKGHPQDSMTPY